MSVKINWKTKWVWLFSSKIGIEKLGGSNQFNSGITMPAWHVPIDFKGTRIGWAPWILLWTSWKLRLFLVEKSEFVFPNGFTVLVYILQVSNLVISVFSTALKNLSLQNYAVLCSWKFYVTLLQSIAW